MVEHITIQSTIPRIRYIADGTLTTFEFPFAIFKDSDLKVYFGETLQESGYTVSGANSSDGGSVTFTSAPTASTIITLTRKLNIERTSDFQEGGALRANVLNSELDYQVACLQEVADNLNRSMVLPPYAVGTDVNLTLPTPSAGKAIVWNSAGNNLENSTIAVNELESTIGGYKTAAETASVTATTKATEAAASAATASAKASLATEQATLANTKATEVANALTTKANISADNFSNTGKQLLSSLAYPSDEYLDITIATGQKYIAPANGYILIDSGNAVSASDWLTLWDTTGTNKLLACGAVAGYPAWSLPISKGQQMEIEYTGTPIYIRFVYAEGEL